MKNILVTTKHRGVFFAQVTEETLNDHKKRSVENPGDSQALTDLKACRMAIYWGTTKGVMQLAEEGPNNNSKIGSPSDLEILHDVTAIFNVTDKAAEKWLSK